MKQRHRWLPAAAGFALAVAGAWMATEIAKIGLARQAAQGNLGSFAYKLRPSNSRGAALLSGLKQEMGDLAAAERLAVEAVRASPIDVVALRTLGETRNRRRSGSGDSALLLAARLSWRDRPTQLWVLQRALMIGDMQIAMERAEVLARVQPDNPMVFMMLRLLALDGDGRRLLIEALSRQPVWRTYFLTDGAPKTPQQIDALSRVLEGLKRTPAPPTIVEAREGIDALVLSGRPARAQQVYTSLFGTGASASVYPDSGFERRDTDYQPANNNTLLDWRVYASGSAQAGVEDEPGGARNRVLFATSAGNSAELLSRTIVLSPGRYRFSYRVRADEPSAPDGFRWVITCGRQGGAILEQTGVPLRTTGWARRSADLQIPVECESQTIRLLALGRTDNGEKEAWFDDVSIVRA